MFAPPRSAKARPPSTVAAAEQTPVAATAGPRAAESFEELDRSAELGLRFGEVPTHSPRWAEETSAGRPLPVSLRAKMEASFGHSFAPVRVHENGNAQTLGAVAYTRGNDIHFAPGEYQPQTESGQALIGHELTHVVQQRAGNVAVPQGKAAPINDNPRLEAEADVQGARAARGEPATATRIEAGGMPRQSVPGGSGFAASGPPLQMAKKRKKQRTPSFKERQAQSERDKAAAAFVPAIEDPDDNAWAASVAATQPLIGPTGYKPVKIGRQLGGDMDANTSFSDRAREIRVTYDEDAADARRDRRIGQLSSTFTHELAVHGSTLGRVDPDEEHSGMHAPDTRRTYLDASHATIDSLENDSQKKAYAKAWHADMMNQISWDENLGKGEKRARREWVRRQRDLMKKR